jgi:formimidoylglutamate deiminase
LRSESEQRTAWLPELIYVGGRFLRNVALITDERTGRVVSVTRDVEGGAARVVRLKDRALLPGMVNAHSHAFQRVIRGRTEFRSSSRDTFWTWREMMYSAAERLTPEDLYDASRMAFLEMALGGIASVGEFHYLHHNADGTPYDDPNLLSKQVVRAARAVGLRIALLRVAYARSGFDTPPNARQRRFITRNAQDFIKHADALRDDLTRDSLLRDDESDTRSRDESDTQTRDEPNATLRGEPDNESRAVRLATAWVGCAPHSLRAVQLNYLREVCEYARARALPVHMHVAEQPAEVEACRAEHGRTPVALLAGEGLLDARFTAVHAVHVNADEAHSLARARAHVCACPTTERNLGDGIVPADLFFKAGARIALGTDSHAQIDLLEDARELEYHLRLAQLSRAVLAPAPQSERDAARDAATAHENDSESDDANDVNGDDANEDARAGANARAFGGTNDDMSERASDADQNFDQRPSQVSSLAARLFACATTHGAASVGAHAGALEPGRAADFFTVALDDASIAGAGYDDLLATIVFSLSRAAVREVVINGRLVVEEGRHRAQEEIVARFVALQRKLWR